MGGDRTIARLGDHLTQVIDNRGKTPPNDTVRTDYELLEVNCLTGSGRRPNYEVVRKFVTKDTYNSWFRNGHPKPSDVIISTVGSIGEVCISEGRGSIAQNLIALSPEANSLTGEFLYYYLCSPAVKNELLTLNISSVQPSIKVPHLLDLEIPLPPLPEQKAIAHILGSLDDKIELNRRMNATLEAMAQALFKSWFVDFDPVIDNALAAGNPIPEELHPRAETRKTALAMGTANRDIAEHFPDSFQETESIGWIPKGWEEGIISDIASLNPEAWSNRNQPTEVTYVDLANTKNGRINDTVTYSFSDAPNRARRILRVDDTILGTVRPGNRSFAYIHEEGLTGSTGFAVLRSNSIEQRTFVYLCLTQDEAIDYFAHIADGGAYPAIRPEIVGNYAIPIPPAGLVKEFDRSTYPSIAKIGQNEKQSATLTKLRDTLLPKLISGELRIPEAEKLAEEVAG